MVFKIPFWFFVGFNTAAFLTGGLVGYVLWHLIYAIANSLLR